MIGVYLADGAYYRLSGWAELTNPDQRISEDARTFTVTTIAGSACRSSHQFRKIIAVNRNVGFFTTGYNWLIQIIPALIVAPSFMSGKVEFGVISQAAVAFSAVVAAFSLIVTQFQSLSNYAAVTAGLSAMVQVTEAQQQPG